MTYGDDANKVAYSYDNLGRTAAKTLTVDGRTYETGYSYLPGSNGSGNTTALISVLSQPGEAFSYTYDDVGNISSVTRNGMTTTYVYDKLGQLIRVNDPEDTADGTTWVYEYDLGGNILNKKRYAYTTGDLGSVLETIAYEYDSVWKDKLVKYDGNAITYDAIGNPLTDGTWTYTWEKGRQLKQMTKPGTTATFAYNADGLRIRKTVNGVDTNYTLHGKNIVHMTQGANDLHFWYDAQNRPAIVQFNGEKYGYVVNLQGDIVGLIDNTGTEVVKYVYDAWGKILSTSGSLASTLGTIQPFRYRGYVFDHETGLYYLYSRFYSLDYSRMINPDSLIIIKGVLLINSFSYCFNSPVTFSDKSGFLPIWDGVQNVMCWLPRTKWKVVVWGLNELDCPHAALLLEHSLQNNPEPMTFYEGSSLVDAIKNNDQYKAKFSEMAQQIIAGETVVKSDLTFSDMDLFGALHIVTITVTGQQENGVWRFDVHLYDRYDFRFQWDTYFSSLEMLLITIGNNMAWYEQLFSVVVNYDVNIYFEEELSE